MQCGMAVLALLLAMVLATGRLHAASDAATVETCFTPQQLCTGIIVAAIERARREIKVEAYGFTSPPILDALVKARRRGLDVQVILDRTNASRGRNKGAMEMTGAGVPVWIDHRSGIAHNKVVVIDGHLVITGSFNFTVSADRKNAENVVVLESPTLAARYLANWRSLLAVARPYDGQDSEAGSAVARPHGRHRHRVFAWCHGAGPACR